MRETTLPPVPQSRFEGDLSAGQTQNLVSAPKRETPLDAAFLGRIYRSMLWFGAVAALISVSFWDGAGVGSFVGGLVLAALLLRTQEVLVRAVVRPAQELGGFDPRLALMVVLPIKYVFVVGALVGFNLLGLIRPLPLAAGFFAAQLVIVLKVVGWMAMRPKN